MIGNYRDIIIAPVITEKSAKTAENGNKVVFRVKNDANKVQIKQAVEAAYNVTVEDVNTMNVSGKNKTRYTKAGIIKGSTSSYKKAVVTLKEGDSIDFYNNI